MLYIMPNLMLRRSLDLPEIRGGESLFTIANFFWKMDFSRPISQTQYINDSMFN